MGQRNVINANAVDVSQPAGAHRKVGVYPTPDVDARRSFQHIRIA